MDRISVTGIRAHGRHGADPGERDSLQPFDVEISFDIDLRAAALSDDLGETVSYAELTASIVTVIETTSFALLERLGGEILKTLFRDARIARMELTLSKPGKLNGATPSVTLIRDNPRWQPST